jgi:hypothetical protein
MSSERYFDLVKRLIREDYEGYKERCEQLDETGWEGLGYVVGATFYLAVREEMGTADVSEVIRLVADTRSEIVETGFDLDPTCAEVLIRAALTGDTAMTETFEPAQVIENEMLLLWKLLRGYDDKTLHQLFEKAAALADKWAT